MTNKAILREIHRENYFYCAEFIKYILKNSNIQIELPAMPRPENFEKIKESEIIYKGILNHYKLVSKDALEKVG